MLTIKGVLSFPTVFTPKVPATGGDPKFSCTILLAPNDPQVAQIQQVIQQAKANQWPSGAPHNIDECLQAYDVKYAGKSYYDARFSGWWALSANAKAEDRPPVLDINRQPVIDPSQVYSGCIAWVALGVSAYTKGTGGIGGWLNGVMVTGEEGPFGRLDGRPDAEAMFAGVPGGAFAAPAAAPVPPAPVPPAPVPPAAPAAPVRQMTAAAAGITYEQYKATGWSDEQLIAGGLLVPPAATPSWQ